MARTELDEKWYRQNILWDAKKEMETLARIAGMLSQEDIGRAMSAKDEEMGHFYSYFSGSHARRAASFAILALGYRDEIAKLERKIKKCS